MALPPTAPVLYTPVGKVPALEAKEILEVSRMSKSTIIKWWIWGLVAMIPAGILIPSSSLALAAHSEGVSGGYGWTMVGLIVVGGLFALAGLAALLTAWVKAVLGTRQLADPRWFKALLWGGIAGLVTMPLFGLGALVLGAVMTAYLVAGPDQAAAGARPAVPAKGTITTWGGWGFAAIFAGLSLAMMVANWTNRGGPLHGIGWPSLAILSAGITAAVTGAIVVWAAWWAALFSTHTLPDRTWFRVLLWSGIAAAVTTPAFGLGGLILMIALIAYWRSAPDPIAVQPPELPAQMPMPARQPGNARDGQLVDAQHR
jgi:hypothetical protein